MWDAPLKARNEHFCLSERPSHFSKSALRAEITVHCLRQTRAMMRRPHAVYIGMRRTAAASASCVQNALRCAPWARAQQQRTRSASSIGQHLQARQGSTALCQQQGCRVGVKLLSTLLYFGVFFRGLEPKIFFAGLRPAPRWGSRPRPRLGLTPQTPPASGSWGSASDPVYIRSGLPDRGPSQGVVAILPATGMFIFTKRFSR